MRLGTRAFAFLCVTAFPLAAQEFEVASVKLTQPSAQGFISVGPLGANTYTATNMPLYGLVQVAYGVPYEQIVGMDKLGTEHYDIKAKAEDGVQLTPAELKPRVRRLLEDRFHLRAHMEAREYDGFHLVVVNAKVASKLKPTDGTRGGGSVYPGGLRLPGLTLADFAIMIRSTAGKPVADKTNIEGRYDFQLDWARDTDPQSTLPSFFTALQEQLGLRLESAKVRLESIVIDSVDKIPSDN